MNNIICSCGRHAVSLKADGTVALKRLKPPPSAWHMSEWLRQLLPPYDYYWENYGRMDLMRLASKYEGHPLSEFEAAILNRRKLIEDILCSDYKRDVARLTADGVIKVEHFADAPYQYISEGLYKKFLAHGYKAPPANDALAKLVFAFDGQPMEQLEAEIAKRGKVKMVARAKEAKRQALWDKLPLPLRSLIVGINSLEFYPTGFSVYVNLNTSYSQQQQHLLLRRGKYDIARWLKVALVEQGGASLRSTATNWTNGYWLWRAMKLPSSHQPLQIKN